MKRIYTLLLCAFVSFATLQAQSSDHTFGCASEPTAEELAFLRSNHQERMTYLRDQGSRAIKVVKIAIHIIRTDAGGSGISEANVQARIDNANVRYADANIRLEVCGPYNYIDDTDYSTFNYGTDETIRTGNDVPGCINIYFANSVLDGGGTGICGYAKFPTASTATTGTNFTVVANGCHVSTFAHELGHCFGLLHTHSTSGGAELVDRSSSGNCATAGDGFCDTPADPQLSSSTVNTSCVYTGTATDGAGVTYAPDPNNIMSYSRKECRTVFSPSQLSSVNYSANNDYALSRCGGGPVTCSSYLALFPNTQGFEGGTLPAGWAQGTDDDGNWTIHSGSTSSANTGPSGAYNGTYYAYIESSSPNYPSKNFSLLGPCFNTTNASNSYVSFNYHMYGATMGSLSLQLSFDEGNTWTTLWTTSGDKGDVWNYQYVTLNSYLDQPSMRIRFYGTTGSSFTSDIAIDDVTIYRNTLSTYAKLPYVDGFEGGSFNSYWSTGSDNAFGRVQVTSANQPGGEYHATMDVNTDNNYATNHMDLGLRMYLATDVELSFDWKEFSDETHTEDGVYLSTDAGTNWTKIYSLTGGTSLYQRVTLDISALAAANSLSLSNSTKIRWQQYDNYRMTTDGIAIDNILVTDGSSDALDLSAFGAPAREDGPLPLPLIEGLQYFPNPFSDAFTLSVPDGQGGIEQVLVYDLTGQLVYEAHDLPEGHEVRLGQGLAPGIYLVRVHAQGTAQSFKAVKGE